MKLCYVVVLVFDAGDERQTVEDGWIWTFLLRCCCSVWSWERKTEVSGLLGMNFYHCVVVAVFGAEREGFGAVFVGAKITHRLVSSATTTTCRVTLWDPSRGSSYSPDSPPERFDVKKFIGQYKKSLSKCWLSNSLQSLMKRRGILFYDLRNTSYFLFDSFDLPPSLYPLTSFFLSLFLLYITALLRVFLVLCMRWLYISSDREALPRRTWPDPTKETKQEHFISPRLEAHDTTL